MDDYVFQARGLEFRYDGGIVAIENLNLNIARGEQVSILGANGSGKSTLLKLLDGLLFATSGELLAFGKPLTQDALENDDFSFAFRQRVGLVFQDPDVQLFSPTVWDEVAFGPLQMDIPKDEVKERVEAALKLLDIEKLRERSPHHLSGGEKKRVALASVLSMKPQVLLLDEPTAGLDPRSQMNLVDFLGRLHQEDSTTLIVATHDLDIIEAISDRALVMDETHRVAVEGKPAEILADTDFLLKVNLIHEHSHRHRNQIHAHAHLEVKHHKEES